MKEISSIRSRALFGIFALILMTAKTQNANPILRNSKLDRLRRELIAAECELSVQQKQGRID